MKLLDKTINSIKPLDKAFLDLAQKKLDSLTKPQGSLGKLEEIAKRVVAITENIKPVIKNKAIVTMAGDHGVAEEGVSAFPQEVTRQMVLNFASGGAAISVLARHAGARVEVVDMGVIGNFEKNIQVVNKKVAHGTKNFTKGPAMTREEAVKAIESGIETVTELKRNGLDIVGTGDMGIANTTPSSAVAAVFLRCPVKEVVGRGTGIDDKTLSHKIKVIEKGIALNRPDPQDPIDVLSKVGGFEIGGIAGVVLGAASMRVPVIIDGLISTAGALIAYHLCPLVGEYIFSSHASVELGHAKMLGSMGLKPFFYFDMRLGEGTGSAIAMTIVEASVKILNEMATFDSAGVSEKSETVTSNS